MELNNHLNRNLPNIIYDLIWPPNFVFSFSSELQSNMDHYEVSDWLILEKPTWPFLRYQQFGGIIYRLIQLDNFEWIHMHCSNHFFETRRKHLNGLDYKHHACSLWLFIHQSKVTFQRGRKCPKGSGFSLLGTFKQGFNIFEVYHYFTIYWWFYVNRNFQLWTPRPGEYVATHNLKWKHKIRGEGSMGRLRPPLCPDQSPGRGSRGRSLSKLHEYSSYFNVKNKLKKGQ